MRGRRSGLHLLVLQMPGTRPNTPMHEASGVSCIGLHDNREVDRLRERGWPLSAEQVCERIRSAILSGELKPGAKLTEQDLAAEFEIEPRTPIREAIRQLEVERLVSRTHSSASR